MSSSTSDSFLNTPIINTITGYISQIQERNIFTKERFRSIRSFFFQSIGFSLLLYCLFQILMLCYFLIKLLLKMILKIILWIPSNIVHLVLPKMTTYNILFPMFWFCSFTSFIIAKFSQKNIEIYLEKRSQVLKRYSFSITFILILLLQILLILVPIAASIHEQRTLSSTMPSVLNELNKREEYLRIKSNQTANMGYSSRGNRLEIESDTEDDRSIAADLRNKVKRTQLEVMKVKKKKSPNELKLEQEISAFRHIFNKWLDEAWYTWHHTKFDFQKNLTLSRKFTYHVPNYDTSSVYAAYVDLNCYDYRGTYGHSPLFRRKFNNFLNAYRQTSPFPVYLSILKTNGPKCYRQYPNSSCAIESKPFFSKLEIYAYHFLRFWKYLSILILILVVIHKAYTNRLDYIKRNLSSNQTQEIISDKINNLSSEKLSSNITDKYRLDKILEKDLRIWLKQEQKNQYKNLLDLYRTSLNDTFSKEHDDLNIETLQFANAKIHHVSQLSTDSTVINAMLDIDHLIINMKNQYCTIEIAKLTGELEIVLINRTNQYSIEVKFKQIQIDNAEIINSKNALSSDAKESIIRLLKQTITQTVVPYCFYLSDNQENLIDEPQTHPSRLPSVSPSSNIYDECEIPSVVPVVNNTVQKSPPKEIKKLLIRIVKAVRLHNVEQPFCILELNQPKQTHQTSIANNGLNPFWDERFVFDCNDKSNQLRLQIVDRKKPNRKHTNNLDTIYADVFIPFSYVTSTIYKQDVRITPQHPDSIIRIEFSTLSEDEASSANNDYDNESITDSQNWSNIGREENKIQHDHFQTSSDDMSTANALRKGYKDETNTHNYTSSRCHRITDTYSTLSPLPHIDDDDDDDDGQGNSLRKSRSFIYSLRHCTFSRRKKHNKKGKHQENGVISPFDSTIQTNTVAHSVSAEPFVSSNNTTGLSSFPRNHTISRSFRDFFRSNSKRTPLNTTNFVMDHPDLLSTSTPTRKKRSFFRHFKSKRKQQPISLSTNSLNSYDRTRAESVRNTPVRANVGRPITMTKPVVQ